MLLPKMAALPVSKDSAIRYANADSLPERAFVPVSIIPGMHSVSAKACAAKPRMLKTLFRGCLKRPLAADAAKKYFE
jgi:hypothetical protein